MRQLTKLFTNKLVENSGEELFRSIKRNSRVSIKTPHGNIVRGKAVMYNKQYDSWVLNLGGRYGTPGIASVKNVVAVDGKKLTEDIDTLKRQKDDLTKQKKDLSAKKKSATTAPGGGDKTTSAELGKKISDIGAKQADVKLKVAKEKELTESPVDSSVVRDIIMIARNDGVAQKRNDPTAAVEFAIETYMKKHTKDLRRNLERAKSRLIMGLQQHWKKGR